MPSAHYVETPTFIAEAARVWSEEERLDFFGWIAADPGAGVVVRGSGGCRKVRWSRPGTGKSGGVRVIYFARPAVGELWMLLIYPKAEKDNIPAYCSRPFGKSWNMASRKGAAPANAGEILGRKLLQSVREMKAGMHARVTKIEVNAVVHARQKTGLSQAQFAEALHISKRTLQEWEQGRRSPSGAAQALIRIAERHPEVVLEVLA